MSTQETESNESTVNNDNLSVTITKSPNCQIKFDIKVSPKAVQAAHVKALKNINKEVTIPGFRKGKAPNAFIIEKYQSSIQKELLDLVLQTGFNDAINLTNVHYLKDGHMKRPVVHECSQEKGAHFIIEFEGRPEIPSVKLEDLKLPKIPKTPVTDKNRENAMQNLLLQFATYEPIRDRPVQEDDFVDISVLLLEEPQREVIKNQRSQVNATGLPSWLRQKIVGLSIGESAEGMTEQDLNLVEKDPNFKSLAFRVTVHNIMKGNLPSIDEDLAKRVGLQSVEELREKINERLEEEIKEDEYKLQIQAIENLLIEKYPVDLPKSYIDNNKEARLTDYFEQRKEMDFSKEEYDEIEKMIEQSTIYHLQLFFLFRKLAADHHITINNEDLSHELTRQISLMSRGQSSIDLSGDREVLRDRLENLALDRKIKQFLIDHTTFVE